MQIVLKSYCVPARAAMAMSASGGKNLWLREVRTGVTAARAAMLFLRSIRV